MTNSPRVICFSGVFCSTRRRHVLRVRPSRRTATTVLWIGPRGGRPEQAWPVRFALRRGPVRRVSVRGRPVRGRPLRGLPVRRLAVRGLSLRRHVVRHLPAGVFAVRRLAVRRLALRRRSTSPVRRSLVVRHVPRRQNVRLTVRLLPVSTARARLHENAVLRSTPARSSCHDVTLCLPLVLYTYITTRVNL